MAMYHDSPPAAPGVGDIVKHPPDIENSYERVMVFDGSNWIQINESSLQGLNLSQLRELLLAAQKNKELVTDSYLEGQYADLKVLREQQEVAYTQLRDKYKVFEILKQTRAIDA